jgi:hypothetical protein
MLHQQMNLVSPDAKCLPGYAHALQQGWSPDNLRPQTASDQLAHIDEGPDRFLREQVDREAKGPPIVLPDGSTVPRLPGYSLWMWGWRILWFDWLSLATGHDRVAAILPGTRRILGGSLGAPRRIGDAERSAWMARDPEIPEASGPEGRLCESRFHGFTGAVLPDASDV